MGRVCHSKVIRSELSLIRNSFYKAMLFVSLNIPVHMGKDLHKMCTNYQ